MGKLIIKENDLSNKVFIRYLIRSIVIWIFCGVIGTAITYLFIDESIVINPTNKTIISISIITTVYIITAIVGWFVFASKRNQRGI